MVPFTPPDLTFTKLEFTMLAFVTVALLKSTPLRSLFDKSTPGPIMYPPRRENVVSGKIGRTGVATMLPDFTFRSTEFVKFVPVRLVPLKSWSVNMILVKSA